MKTTKNLLYYHKHVFEVHIEMRSELFRIFIMWHTYKHMWVQLGVCVCVVGETGLFWLKPLVWLVPWCNWSCVVWFRGEVVWVYWRGSVRLGSTRWRYRGVCCTLTLAQSPTSPRTRCITSPIFPLSLRSLFPTCKQIPITHFLTRWTLF